MITTVEICVDCTNDREHYLSLDIEYTWDEGYPGTYYEPGEPAGVDSYVIKAARLLFNSRERKIDHDKLQLSGSDEDRLYETLCEQHEEPWEEE